MKQKKIVIFTNGLKYLAVKKDSKNGNENMFDYSHYLNWKFEEIDIDAFDNCKILLIYDNIGIEIFNIFSNKEYDSSDLYFLTHQNTKIDVSTLNKFGFTNVLEGMHMSGASGKYYPDVIEILESNFKEDDAYNKIWEILWGKNMKTNIVLTFLHYCLTPQELSQAEKIVNENQEWCIQDKFAELGQLKNEQDKYINKLREIRDMLI